MYKNLFLKKTLDKALLLLKTCLNQIWLLHT